ncbi:MAG: DUF1648 domain-containing protein [Bacteroidia bacterium]|nr:DUF1648 domain-containing protein [Bacteroidia bacterium]
MRTAMRLNVSLLILAAMLSVWFYPQLPERLASHFNASGEADGWMTKDGFFLFYGLLLLLMFGMFAGITWMVRRFPVSMVNIPHREYWLAPERREEAYAVLQRNMHRMSAATLLFMNAMLLISFRANFKQPPSLGSEAWILMLLFLAGLAVLIVRLYQDFRLPRNGARGDASN